MTWLKTWVERLFITRGFHVKGLLFSLYSNGVIVNEISFRIERNGSVLVFYRINDDSQWTELEESPIERSDMDNELLQAGIYQTSEATATAVVGEFSIMDERMHASGFE